MTEHYYTDRPESKHDPQTIQTKLRGVELRLQTDAGVFSRQRIDRGTELLVQALPLDPNFRTVLDLGCGYGVIGLTLARLLPQATLYLTDINQRAVELAQQNAIANQVSNVVIKAGEGFVPVAGVQFDLVATNPPLRAGKAVVYALIDQSFLALRPGGWLAAVCLTRQGAKSLERKMAEVFGNVTEWEKGSGYRVMASRKDRH